MDKEEYFTRFPNEYIQANIKTTFGVSRKFYITYILIDRYRSYEDYSWITIRKILEFYGYKTTKHKPKAFHEILDVLEYMINNRMIEVRQDLDSIGYDTGIEIKIISENFDAIENFSKITSSQLDFIMTNESSINKENILMEPPPPPHRSRPCPTPVRRPWRSRARPSTTSRATGTGPGC